MGLPDHTAIVTGISGPASRLPHYFFKESSLIPGALSFDPL